MHAWSGAGHSAAAALLTVDRCNRFVLDWLCVTRGHFDATSLMHAGRGSRCTANRAGEPLQQAPSAVLMAQSPPLSTNSFAMLRHPSRQVWHQACPPAAGSGGADGIVSAFSEAGTRLLEVEREQEHVAAQRPEAALLGQRLRQRIAGRGPRRRQRCRRRVHRARRRQPPPLVSRRAAVPLGVARLRPA